MCSLCRTSMPKARTRGCASAAPAAAATSARGKLLGELDTVPVRVEDVQEADLAVQLEDDADLDPLRAQPLRLGLQVGHVDVRHAAVLLRLAPREADLHVAAPEPRPAALGVEVRLGEAERVAVEAAPGVQVAHVVPDRHETPVAFRSAA